MDSYIDDYLFKHLSAVLATALETGIDEMRESGKLLLSGGI
jgi:hypothetical protein